MGFIFVSIYWCPFIGDTCNNTIQRSQQPVDACTSKPRLWCFFIIDEIIPTALMKLYPRLWMRALWCSSFLIWQLHGQCLLTLFIICVYYKLCFFIIDETMFFSVNTTNTGHKLCFSRYILRCRRRSKKKLRCRQKKSWFMSSRKQYCKENIKIY